MYKEDGLLPHLYVRTFMDTFFILFFIFFYFFFGGEKDIDIADQ